MALPFIQVFSRVPKPRKENSLPSCASRKKQAARSVPMGRPRRAIRFSTSRASTVNSCLMWPTAARQSRESICPEAGFRSWTKIACGRISRSGSSFFHGIFIAKSRHSWRASVTGARSSYGPYRGCRFRDFARWHQANARDDIIVKKRRVMVVTAGRHQASLILKAKALDCEVLATDRDAGAASFTHADRHAVVDSADGESLLSVARDFSPDAILSEQTDIAIPAVAY